jgi:hypothetical protein
LVVRHLSWFHSLAIVNNATVNMSVQESLLHPNLHSFRYMLKSSIAIIW